MVREAHHERISGDFAVVLGSHTGQSRYNFPCCHSDVAERRKNLKSFRVDPCRIPDNPCSERFWILRSAQNDIASRMTVGEATVG